MELGAQRAQLAALLPRAGALFPQFAGGESGRREHQADRGITCASRSGWRRSPRGFSEEDLTRYLQLTLDLFKDLQFSLQPRLHLEIGLLRLVQAGKLRIHRRGAIAIWAVAVRRRLRRASLHRRPTHNPPTPASAPPAREPPARAPGATACTRRCSNPECRSTADAMEHSEVGGIERQVDVRHARGLRACP